MAELVVVDSQARARTLQDLSRGRSFQILACPGEVRVLGGASPEKAFEPSWSWDPGRQRSLRELRRAADGAERILIATDPDARGELRAAHLAAALDPRPVLRLWLDAMTPAAFDDAVSGAQPLDARLFEGELTRRLGFGLVAAALERLGDTPRAASSWAACLLLQLVAEREAKVAAWRPEPGLRLRARLVSQSGFALRAELDGCVRSSEAAGVREALQPAAWRVSRVRTRRRSSPPPPPLGVVALAHAAEQELRFPSARTLEIARRLYDGKPLQEGGSLGLITWHMSPGGTRPTEPGRDPETLVRHLAQDERALYGLIREADREARQAPESRRDTRVAIEVQGWQFTAQWPPSELETPARTGLRRGAQVTLEELDLIPADEDAPGRLSEAEALEQLAGAALASPEEVPPLIASLEEASLLVRRGVRLHPTRQGQRLLERLGAEQPGLLDVHRARDFTRQIAGIAAGRHGRAAVLAPFERWLREGGAPSPPATPPPTARRSRERPRGLGLRCPRCARGEIVERRKRGAPLPFFACSRYPECRFTSSATPVAGPCPSCGAPLLRARARRTFCAEPGCGYARRGSSEPIIGA